MEAENPTLDINSITSLSDEDLIKNLKKNGLKFGPVTATTRYLYEKRLRQFLDPTLIEKEKEAEENHQQSAPEQKQEPSTQVDIETISHKSHEQDTEEVPVETKRDQIQVESKVTISSIETPETDLNKSTDSVGNSSDNYLNISGIRGRAPLKRQNDQINSQNSTSQSQDSKGSVVKYLVLFSIIALCVYFVQVFVMDSDENNKDF